MDEQEWDAFQIHAAAMAENFLSFAQQNQMVDVTLVASIGQKRIKAHRVILSAVSPYFRGMFCSSLRESRQNEVVLMGISNEVLEAVVEYIYTSRLVINSENADVLLEAACLFQIQGMINILCDHAIKHLDKSNCLGVLLFAEGHNLKKLHEKSYEYMCLHFEDVAYEQEFLQLDSDQLAKILQNDDLNITTEAFMFQVLMLWMRHDKENRQVKVPYLLNYVRLSCLSPEEMQFISDHIEDMCQSGEVTQYVIQGMKWHLLPDRRNSLPMITSRPRKSTMGLLLAIGGMNLDDSGQYKTFCVDTYCPRVNQWRFRDDLQRCRSQFGLAIANHKIYIVGGRDGLKTLNTVHCYDVSSNKKWEAITPMNTPRHGLAVASLGGPLYAIGGHDGWSYLNSVERLDTETGVWQLIPPMSTPRSTAGVAVLNGNLYVIGGRDGALSHNTVEFYNPLTNAWYKCASMNERRGGVGVCALLGYIYAVGGADNAIQKQTVERYCPVMDCWEYVKPMDVAREAISCTVMGDRLYACGGYNGQSYTNVVQEYDPDTNTWTGVASMLRNMAVCVITVPSDYSQKNEWKPLRPSAFLKRFHVYGCYM